MLHIEFMTAFFFSIPSLTNPQVMNYLVKKRGLTEQWRIDSAGTRYGLKLSFFLLAETSIFTFSRFSHFLSLTIRFFFSLSASYPCTFAAIIILEMDLMTERSMCADEDWAKNVRPSHTELGN
jgi:hypothetical protein